MPRDITRQMLKVLNSDAFAPIALMDIRIAGSSVDSTLHLTNAGKSVSWGGNTYLPVNMTRSQVKEVKDVDAQEQPSITITVSNVDRKMAGLLNRIDFVGAEVTLWMHDRRLIEKNPTRTRDAIRWIDGELRNPLLNNATFVFEVLTVSSMLSEVPIPKRVFSSECGYAYGSEACGVDLHASPNTIESTAQAGTNARLIVVPSSVITAAGSPPDPTDFWLNGYIAFKDGVCAVQSRPIQRVVGNNFYLRTPFQVSPAAGDGLIVRRSCGRTKPHCLDRQGNVDQFGGFEEVPFEVKPVIVRGF